MLIIAIMIGLNSLWTDLTSFPSASLLRELRKSGGGSNHSRHSPFHGADRDGTGIVFPGRPSGYNRAPSDSLVLPGCDGFRYVSGYDNRAAFSTLCFWRIVTGVGIGGMLTAITALSTEFSSLPRRHLCVSLMAIGYPIGGVVGGLIASRLLANYDWRSVFYLGALITALFIPVVFFLVPESIHWLTRKQPAGALGENQQDPKKLQTERRNLPPAIG